MAVLLDISHRSIVVFCTDCTGWSDIVTTMAAADRLTRTHCAAAHPGERPARSALDKRTERTRRPMSQSG